MATLPTRLVEIEFDAGVWIDVAADVVTISTQRGRNKESGAFETGRIAVVLRNDGRKYDPDHTSGPYYGKLRPNRRIRFRATYSAVTYDVFLGFIDRITQGWSGPNDATATIEASDFFKILNRVELPTSVYAAEVIDDAPAAFYRLDEPVGAPTVTDSVGGFTLDATGSPAFGQGSLVVRDPGTAVSLTATGVDTIHRQVLARPLSGPPLSLELFYKRTAASSDGNLMGQVSLGNQGGVWLTTNAAGAITLVAVNGAGASNVVVSTGVNLNDLVAHHIVGTWASGGALKIYVDGVDRTGTPASLATTAFQAAPAQLWVGGTPPGLVEHPDAGTYQNAAFYATELTLPQVVIHNDAARTPWRGDDPGTRLVRIFSLVGFTGSYAVDAGSTTLQSTSLGGTALGYAQKVEETEGGRLFVDRAGVVTFVGRNTAITGAYLTSQATLVDADSGAGQDYRSASADVDDSRIVTRATVSREGSVAVTYSNAAAIAEFGLLDETHDGLLHDSDAYSRSYAEWIVNTLKAPTTRVGTTTLELPFDPADLYPTILALEIGEQVTWKRKPQNTGAVISLAMRVEAIGHETGAHYWRTSLFLSPFNPAGGVGVGVWDVSLWDQAVWGL